MNENLIAALAILEGLERVHSTTLDPSRKTEIGQRLDEVLLVIKFYSEKMVSEIPP